MQLKDNVKLAGKYIILSSLYDSETYIMYLAKAPSLGEEFVLVEFFPRDIVTRDEDDYVAIPPDSVKDYEQNLEKFTSDCTRLMHITANRFFGLREVLTEMGSAFAVTRKPVGELLSTFIGKMGADEHFNDTLIDGVYDALNSLAREKIPVTVNQDTVYVENVGLLMFMYEYKLEFNEADAVTNMAALLYLLITKKSFDNEYQASLIPQTNKYYEVITGIHDNREQYPTFHDVNKLLDKNYKTVKDEPLKAYLPNLIILVIIILIIGAGAAYGFYVLLNRFLA